MKRVKILFQEAKEIANKISFFLARERVYHEICGVLRRQSLPTANEIAIVVNDFPRAWEVIHENNGWHGVPIPAHKNKPKRFGVIPKLFAIPVKLHHATEEEWGAMRLYLTGNHFFTIQMRSEAKRQGMTLNQYGLWFNENIIAGRTEEQIFEALEVPFIPPFKRELIHRQTLAEVIVSL